MIEASTQSEQVRLHAGRDAVAWVQVNADGTGTLYCLRDGLSSLIITGMQIRPYSGKALPAREETREVLQVR